MKSKAHSWITFKAIEYLQENSKHYGLLEMLTENIGDVFQFSGKIPDMIGDCCRGHIFKMDDQPDYLGVKSIPDKYIVDLSTLINYFDYKRQCLDFLSDSHFLEKPYRSHSLIGGQLPERVAAYAINLGLMLKKLDFYDHTQIARTFFMLSHYICDAHMPLHCDLRDKEINGQRRLNKEIHHYIEDYWEERMPSKERLLSINKMADIRDFSEIDFIDNNSLDNLDLISSNNLWQDMVYISRISYALSRKYIDKDFQSYEELICSIGQEKFKIISSSIFNDAIFTIATIWNSIFDASEIISKQPALIN